MFPMQECVQLVTFTSDAKHADPALSSKRLYISRDAKRLWLLSRCRSTQSTMKTGVNILEHSLKCVHAAVFMLPCETVTPSGPCDPNSSTSQAKMQICTYNMYLYSVWEDPATARPIKITPFSTYHQVHATTHLTMLHMWSLQSFA